MAKLVNWRDFEQGIKRKKILLFSAVDICRLFGASKNAVNLLLHRYKKRGFIIRAKRGLYVLPDTLPPELFLANKMCEPSYLSLEFALAYHRVIPEQVYEMTSVTPRSTRRFEVLGKIYSYRSIKKTAFAGYTTEHQKGFSFCVADPEKAFVDAHYFRLLDGLGPMARFDKARIDMKKTLEYAALFDNTKLSTFLRTALS